MKTLGVGILGYGFMGRTHAYAYRTLPFYYDALPVECALRVVCTSRSASAEAARRNGGFERATTDPRELIEAADVDIVHICTPNHLHFDALQAAIQANKHLYVEKPLVAGLDQAQAVEALLPGYRATGQLVLQNRFLPAVLRARQLVEEGALGPITHFSGEYLHAGSVDPDRPLNWKASGAAGGGVIRDLGPHILDLLQWLAGPVSAITCQSRIWAAVRPSAAAPDRQVSVDVEDAASMLLRTPDGAFGTATVSKIATGSEDELRFEIHGRHGALRFDLMQPNYLEYYDARQPDGPYGGRRGWQRIAAVQRYPKPGGFPGPKQSIGWLRGHVHSLQSFLAAVAEGRPGAPSLTDGVQLQRVLEAAIASAQSHCWVHLSM